MVQEVFPTTIAVEQLDVSEEVLSSVEAYLHAIHAEYFALHPEREDIENMHNVLARDDVCDEMWELVEAAQRVFGEMARTCIKYHDMDIDPNSITCDINGASINYVKTGQNRENHTHYSDDAFACIYFRDVQEDEGGEIILHDPRWQRSFWFGGSKQVRIKPKRGMIVAAPNFVWHEVATYTGQDPRMVFVLNGVVNRDSNGITNYGDA